jgi:hypothetical protein
MLRGVLAGVALTLCASQASAQITTYVAPPRPAPPDPAVVAATDSVKRDSLARVAMTNMKEWVDSASGIAVSAAVGDSIPANDPGQPITSFEDGSVAPATASDLPTLAVVGFVFLVVGAGLVANRPRG